MKEKNILPGRFWQLTTGSVAKVKEYMEDKCKWRVQIVTQDGKMKQDEIGDVFKREVTEADAWAIAQSNFRSGLTCFWGVPNLIAMLIKRFEREIWFEGGLQQKVLAHHCRGFKGAWDHINVSIVSMSGRTLITVGDEKKKHFITIIMAQEGKPDDRCEMGIQSRNCDDKSTISLLETAIAHFPIDALTPTNDIAIL